MIVALAMLALGLAFAGVGAAGVWRNHLFLRAAARAEATILSVTRGSRRDGTGRQRRTVTTWTVRGEFTPHGGAPVTFAQELEGGFGPHVSGGQRCEVAYRLDDPRASARVLTGTRGYGAPFGLLAFGVLLLVAFLVALGGT